MIEWIILIPGLIIDVPLAAIAGAELFMWLEGECNGYQDEDKQENV